MIPASTTYRTESELVADLMQHLGKDGFAIGSEFNYSRGKTDVVVLDGGTGEVSAIEAKLTRRRVALHPATHQRGSLASMARSGDHTAQLQAHLNVVYPL